MELPCLREIDRILFVSLWTSVFTIVIDYAILYFGSVTLICSLILQARLDLFCAEIAHHNPTCRHTTWPGKNLVIETGQNCQNYLQWSGFIKPISGTIWLWSTTTAMNILWESERSERSQNQRISRAGRVPQGSLSPIPGFTKGRWKIRLYVWERCPNDGG